MALVRVLLADDHAGVLAYLDAQLRRVFEIVGAVTDGKQAVDATLRLDPDALVLDVSMPVMNGLQAAACLRDVKCRTKIVVLTVHEDPDCIDAAFSSGASGYVSKPDISTDLVTAIRSVIRGSRYISPSLPYKKSKLDLQFHRT
ncbi:MAG TPA: response regulator transcription factor [Candidatus Udaeobacter sp.]|jgi:DNA-binding NarL/FixJ family response regulator|nr:response regulator transcription factor [Candidatus Udaeobacter sp.]